MTLTGKLAIGLTVATVASTITALLQGSPLPDLVLLGAFSAATLATAALVSLPGTVTAEDGPSDTGQREHGKVKWFNVAKGFGFIIKDDGDEIFVHFRSIRGEGRRILRDGQRVAFLVADSAKGPQAEDVVILEP
jgi:CspA family cold shock protein